jgi:hypothetical protein
VTVVGREFMKLSLDNGNLAIATHSTEIEKD